MTKTFLLGVGAQKAGTTWFYHYLRGLPGVDLGFAKEYHVFDFAHVPGRKRWFARALWTAARAMVRKATAGRRRPLSPAARAEADADIRKAWFLLNRRAYFDYFAGLLAQDGVRLTGDLTPSYTGLDARVLQRIKSEFARRGIEVRVILIMRDPLERCWSIVRMGRRNARLKGRKDVPRRRLRLSEEGNLLAVYRSRNYRQLTEYHRTMRNLEAVFQPHEIIYTFYERLFEEATIHDVCDRLGLEYRPADFDRMHNATDRSDDISDETRYRVARFYGDVYREAAERFGRGYVSATWPNFDYATQRP